MYPKVLQNHRIDKYLHDAKFDGASDLQYVASYFHTKEDEFPIGMHTHSFYEINVIAAGSGYHYVENQCYEAEIGTVYVVPPNIRHGYYTEDEDNFSIFHLLLSNTFIERYKTELHSLPGYSVLFEIEPFIRMESNEQLFLKLSEEQFRKLLPEFDELNLLRNSKNNCDSLISTAKSLYLISIFSRLISEYHSSTLKEKTGKNIYATAILRTMEYMQENLGEKIALDDLARLANMSRSTYIRHFKNICNCSPNDYLIEVKIAKACELLRSGDMSIADVAQTCGFFDSSHLGQLFLRSKKCTPSEFRKAAQVEVNRPD